MQVEPLYDRVLVQQDAEKEVISEFEGAEGKKIQLVAAEDHREKPLRGVVVAAGCGRLMDNGEVVALKVKCGDRVLFGRHNGIDLPEDAGLGERIKVMREDEIMAVVRD